MSVNNADAELIIGVVARLGVDTAIVVSELKALLGDYGYAAQEIRVTDAIRELTQFAALPTKPVDTRIAAYMKACNEVRKRASLKDIMARFAISRIAIEREKSFAEGDSPKRAFIVNQLKRTEESTLLKRVYGEHYLQVSCHAHEEDRVARLSTLIADDHPEKPKAAGWRSTAQELIQTDEAEEDEEYGQRVRDIFPLSDVVIDAASAATIRSHTDRFLRAIFGDQTVTPTREEYGMHLADEASLRSSDLSRQVGAAILNEFSEVQALGCNEVAKAGGGTYWEGDHPDGRDFQRRKDSNEERKREVLMDLALRMQRAGLISENYKTPEELSAALLNRDDDIIWNSQMMDSLEYGRAVHAEMNAITDAARGGHAIRACILYSNTFPCHNCAKHIVASGIKEVIYLRPFPKSYADELFSDAIAIDPKVDVEGQVPFRQFIGIVGPLYRRVFEKRRWKREDGSVVTLVKKDATLVQRTPLRLEDYLIKEAEVSVALGQALDSHGLKPVSP